MKKAKFEIFKKADGKYHFHLKAPSTGKILFIGKPQKTRAKVYKLITSFCLYEDRLEGKFPPFLPIKCSNSQGFFFKMRTCDSGQIISEKSFIYETVELREEALMLLWKTLKLPFKIEEIEDPDLGKEIDFTQL